MAFEIPSLEQIRQQVGADVEARLPGTAAMTRRKGVGVLAQAQAGAVHGLHAHIAYRERNFLPDERAEAEGVERWARLLGYGYLEATAATGPAEVKGAAGAVLPAGTQLQSREGVLYQTTDELILVSSTGSVTVEAIDAGAAGNLAAGLPLNLLSPVPGINSTLTIGAPGLAGGADQEKLDGLRRRVLERLRRPPMGGSKDDYVIWAGEGHASVTRAWAYPGELGRGTVTVRVVCDNETDPIPTAPVLAAVQDYIEAVRPVTAEVYVVAPEAVPLNFDIRLSPDSSLLRQRVTDALRDLLRREAEPGGTILRTHIAEAISTAVGEVDHELLAPVANVTHGVGEMAVFGSITWA